MTLLAVRFEQVANGNLVELRHKVATLCKTLQVTHDESAQPTAHAHLNCCHPDALHQL